MEVHELKIKGEKISFVCLIDQRTGVKIYCFIFLYLDEQVLDYLTCIAFFSSPVRLL